MIPIVARSVKIGEGMPKICVPIVGRTKEEIINAAREICDTKADFVEWRADWFENVFEIEETIAIADELRKILGGMPILFTFRTKTEGGEKMISQEKYFELNTKIMEMGNIDLIDVEVFSMEEVAGELIEKAQKNGIKVVGSNHDFERTPKKEEIVERLCHMQKVGVDIPKIAVMPRSEEDVKVLLDATKEMTSTFADRPIVTMSMGELGVVSRIEGEKYGSAITFGCMGKASAPGQINVNELEELLKIRHHSCE